MALDRRTRLASISLSSSLLLACAPAPNDAPDTTARKGPEPTAVCQHLRTLAETTDEQTLDKIERDCVQELEGLASLYETFASCVQRATTPEGVRECEAGLVIPRSLLANLSPTAQLEMVCDHVIDTLRAGIPGMGNAADPAEVDKLRQRCIDEAGKKRESIGVEAFDKQVECLLAATDLPTLQSCGSF